MLFFHNELHHIYGALYNQACFHNQKQNILDLIKFEPFSHLFYLNNRDQYMKAQIGCQGKIIESFPKLYNLSDLLRKNYIQ